MRGSLIQEIFRVVNEIHSEATKKNKEWQEKLPVVVLKSEEIMYSKANSEAEYMDLKTLLDRTNDAINTIIRLDESTETGELLPPCIEAALNLGCMPRRTSRSQRNNNPRCYLNTGIQEPSNVENVPQGNHLVQSQGMAPYCSFMKQTMSATQNLVFQNINGCANKLPFASQNVPPSGNKQCFSLENYPAAPSAYPLYYGTCFKFEEIPPGLENFPNPTSKNTQRYIKDTPDNPQDIGCDLSLRLGPFSVPCPSFEHNQQEQVKEVGSRSQEVNKIGDLVPQLNKQLLFVSKTNDNYPLEACSSQWSVEGDVDTNMRKRKVVSAQSLEDEYFGWQPKLPGSRLTGRRKSMKSAGS